MSYTNNELELFCRCKLKGTTIFGQYMGPSKQDHVNYVVFHDEELRKSYTVKKNRLERTYEKWY